MAVFDDCARGLTSSSVCTEAIPGTTERRSPTKQKPRRSRWRRRSRSVWSAATFSIVLLTVRSRVPTARKGHARSWLDASERSMTEGRIVYR